jgi:asparagine synthase (glutamine-hydrolysing)
MAAALVHRGPDEDGFLELPGLGMASRRLSIIGLADGRQPIGNEDRSIFVVYNGELFDYIEQRAELEGRGHRFATHSDTEVIPHLWEEHQEDTLPRLHGQFAVCLYDQRRQRVVLARDRFGICPLYWTRQRHGDGEWLLFASEIKALLATGLVAARPDPRGINHLFTFFALPGPVTCFAGVELLPPGHYMSIDLSRDGEPARVQERAYWEMDFPDKGEEDPGHNERPVVDEFEEILKGAVERRLRADVPVVSYLSGGVDSSIVVAMACHLRGTPIPTFTIQITDPTLDETSEAGVVARHVGARPVVVPCGPADVINNYQQLITAAEGPVIDTSCTALMLLAEEVHRQQFKVALTGEGSDEWLAGYPWFKAERVLRLLDIIPGVPLSGAIRRAYLFLSGAPAFPWSLRKRVEESIGGRNAWLNIYGMMSLSKFRFFSRDMLEALGDHNPYADLQPNLERMRRWHPFNRSIYLGARAHLAGLLMNAKGDRVAMHSSVETRYPFLDEKVFDFLARLHPRWKMRGLKDKYILRKVSERWLPRQIAWRPKAMFRAPFDSFHAEHVPAFVDQLLSEESIRRAGYFDSAAVTHHRQSFRGMGKHSVIRITLEMGLVGVIATQLWHHTFIDGNLADLPSLASGSQSALRDQERNGRNAPHPAASKGPVPADYGLRTMDYGRG